MCLWPLEKLYINCCTRDAFFFEEVKRAVIEREMFWTGFHERNCHGPISSYISRYVAYIQHPSGAHLSPGPLKSTSRPISLFKVISVSFWLEYCRSTMPSALWFDVTTYLCAVRKCFFSRWVGCGCVGGWAGKSPGGCDGRSVSAAQCLNSFFLWTAPVHTDLNHLIE